ncbi:hypothetical protein BGZ61DRAFT_527528 [Ilyonectria robusta]|uniref:uncharacterized protein n=1 Tax=Ilyonectria robusta TaxID=1079257 RepID=UPI001E8D1F87|nr:uncharacterized protein BGZ61DRAFT_527528 [Ilyonectria robusta]KAH8736593.1 hypothetical protein BGZ61DRAFT_527528 [Ilyonectria robusta]
MTTPIIHRAFEKDTNRSPTYRKHKSAWRHGIPAGLTHITTNSHTHFQLMRCSHSASRYRPVLLGCHTVSIPAADPDLKRFCRKQQGRLEALRDAVASNVTTLLAIGTLVSPVYTSSPAAVQYTNLTIEIMPSTRTVVGPADPTSPAALQYTTDGTTTNTIMLSRETNLLSALERVQCFKDPAEAEARLALLSNIDRINIARLGCRAVSITADKKGLKIFCRHQQGRLNAVRDAVAGNATTETDEKELEKLGRNRAWLLELSHQLPTE